MSSSQHRGLTLIELLIASMVGMLVLSLAVALYVNTQRRVGRVTESYELEHRVSELVDWLQDDLNQTSLGSIQVYPNQSKPEEPPGLSFVSADKTGEFKDMELSPYGTPKWQKHVFYTLEPDPSTPEISRLLRYELPTEQTLPKPSIHLPSAFSDQDTKRIVSRSLLSKGYSFKGLSSGLQAPAREAKAPGGFTPRFLLSDGTSSSENPATRQGEEMRLSTPMLVVNLHVAQNSEAGKWSGLSFRFRVRPRN